MSHLPTNCYVLATPMPILWLVAALGAFVIKWKREATKWHESWQNKSADRKPFYSQNVFPMLLDLFFFFFKSLYFDVLLEFLPSGDALSLNISLFYEKHQVK